jgi:N-acetylglucosaminyldiphosphoundecaprenol N-acetyl-beta-D-mannosaminyltransferase
MRILAPLAACVGALHAALEAAAGPHPDEPRPFADATALPDIPVLGSPVHLVGLEEAAHIMIGWARQRRAAPPDAEGAASETAPVDTGVTRVAIAFNPERSVKAQRDPRVAEALLEADLRFPDGVGVVWAARRRGAQGVERVAGIELAERTLGLAGDEGLPVYFLGASPGIAEEAADAMGGRMPGLRVVGTRDGYFSGSEEPAVVDEIRESGAALLLVAMGSPRQELFIQRHRAALGVGAAMGVGGSFDVWSGHVRRAPGWAQTLGVEWLWRLVTNPRRLKRQAALPVFAWRALTQAPEDLVAGEGRRGRGA